MSSPTQLEIFAFDQAIYVHQAARTCEREMIRDGSNFASTVARLKQTPKGRKYLGGVSLNDLYREANDFCSFALSNTGDKYLPDEVIGTHAELPNTR